TGVPTCALPISAIPRSSPARRARAAHRASAACRRLRGGGRNRPRLRLGVEKRPAMISPPTAEERPQLAVLADIWLSPQATRLSDGAALGPLDEAFHATLAQGSGNREMARVHREITERIRIIRRLDFTKGARIDVTYDEHARILRAITRRRGDEAQRLLRAHIEQSKLEVR